VQTDISVSARGEQTLSEQAYVALRDRIVRLGLPPGAALTEETLMRELGLGRTPIREAVKRLALEDLVVIYPRRGTFVSEINITDLAQISDVRLRLEGHAAYRAAEHATADDRAEGKMLVDELEQLHDGADGDALMRLDARIHRHVYRCSRNPYLESTLDRYLNLSLRIWYLVIDRLPHLEQSVFEHRDLLGAIDQGDATGARELAESHVATFEREIRTVL